MNVTGAGLEVEVSVLDSQAALVIWAWSSAIIQPTEVTSLEMVFCPLHARSVPCPCYMYIVSYFCLQYIFTLISIAWG